MKEECKNYHYNQENQLVRSFGRIKSRKLSPHKQDLLDNLLPKYLICDQDFFLPNLVLEIGCGFGDFIYEQASNNPDKIFFGIEPHINGIVNLLSKLENKHLPNIKIHNQDVRFLIKKLTSNPNFKGFNQIYILFPDPWPKSKHFKRRLINQAFFDNILSPIIKNNGNLIIATDHDSYKSWILAHLLKSKKFIWDAENKADWKNFPKDWTQTKYQKKAAKEGRDSIIIKAIKVH